MGTIRIVRDPHNLSHSRLTSFFGCAARSGYEGFYENSARSGVPYWLAGGGAVHHTVDTIVAKSVADGKVLPKGDVDKEVKAARAHIWLVLSGKIPPRGYKDPVSRLRSIFWMSEEERKQRNPDEVAKTIKERVSRYINQVTPGIRAVALRCTVPSPFKKTETGIRFDHKLMLASPRDPQIKIPVYGEIDVLEHHTSGRLIITDWKTGSFSHYLQEDLEGNEQMLIYWLAVRELYGIDPTIAYFISLSVPKQDVDRYGEGTLEHDRYRAQAKIRFEEHFPELANSMDDVWTVLNFLAYPPRTAEEQKLRDAWEPRSSLGIRMGIRRHLTQGRLIPSIGKHCGMCPEQTRCRADNPEDWQEYETFQRMGSVTNPLTVIPEEWIDPMAGTDGESSSRSNGKPRPDPAEGQLQLFWGDRFHGKSPLKKHTLTAKQWDGYGFFPPKKILALMRRMHELVPLGPCGEVCPCKKTDRIPWRFLLKVMPFFTEREGHKLAQEAEGKKRGGEGKEKVRDLFDSENVRELLNDCPIPRLPFRGEKRRSHLTTHYRSGGCMIPEEKIQEMVDCVIEERSKKDGASMKALLSRAARRARIKWSDREEAFRRAGEGLSKHADVARSVPELKYRHR